MSELSSDDKGGGGADGEGNIRPQTTKKKPPPTKLIPSGVVCLRGNLAQETRDGTAVHIITGLWSMGLDKILADPDNELGLCSDFEYEHKKESGESSTATAEAASASAFPPSGTYTGSFMINNAGVKTKVEEKDVVLNFVENSDGYYNVEGTGSNSFGKYTISGTLSTEGVITIYRHYPLIVAQTTSKVKKKEPVPQVKPPPTKLIPTGAVCLRGKLVRNTSEGCIHKITGLWSMGLDKILADPENTKGECNNFEYEHKASGGVTTSFPLSGKYNGSFLVNAPQGGAKTKIDEKNVVLKFRENNEGYHNVEGKGSNVWGKYSITGTLTKDGEITLFRNYQAVKAQPKKTKKVAAAKQQQKTPAKKKQTTRPGTNKNTASKLQTPNKSFTPSTNPNTAAGEYLLERFRILLNRLQASTEILQNWPETQGDSAKIHADTATELIASIRKIVTGLRAVERHVNGTGPSQAANIPAEALDKFRSSLDEKCPIPLDLLDLLDIGQPFGINPQCYARGLMKEAMRQLAGLERRKNALSMLGNAIEKGLKDRSNKDGTEPTESESATKEVVTVTTSKRKRDEGNETDDVVVVVDTSKKMRTD